MKTEIGCSPHHVTIYSKFSTFEIQKRNCRHFEGIKKRLPQQHGTLCTRVFLPVEAQMVQLCFGLLELIRRWGLQKLPMNLLFGLYLGTQLVIYYAQVNYKQTCFIQGYRNSPTGVILLIVSIKSIFMCLKEGQWSNSSYYC